MHPEDFINVYKALKDQAKVLLAVVPRADTDNGFNAITLGWFMRTSLTPPMFSLSIGNSRYSYICFNRYDYFNLVFPSEKLFDFATFCGSHSGKELDKFCAVPVPVFNGKLNRCPLIKNAYAAFECKYVNQVRTGDHTIFTGEVKYSWLNEKETLLSHL